MKWFRRLTDMWMTFVFMGVTQFILGALLFLLSGGTLGLFLGTLLLTNGLILFAAHRDGVGGDAARLARLHLTEEIDRMRESRDLWRGTAQRMSSNRVTVSRKGGLVKHTKHDLRYVDVHCPACQAAIEKVSSDI